jgi:hypothetical protein
MWRRFDRPARRGSIARSLAVAGLAGIALGASPPAAPPQAPAAQSFSFPSGAGALLFYVRPDRTAEFGAVLARLNDALVAAADPARRAQAQGWRVYRSLEPARDAVIYMFLLDPAPADADYDPVKLLSEAYPTEATTLYETMKGAVVRVERMGLGRLR